MDTSGKGGVIGHAVGMVNPQGVQIASFKRPTPEELAHDFLWRVRKQVPVPGKIGVFDRSHYEDVLIARVDSLVPRDVWEARYDQIVAFEHELSEQGVTVLKCMLHISPEAQAERLLARWSAATPTWPPGTSSRRTGSGTGTGRSRPCWPRRSRTWHRCSHPRTSTSRSSAHDSKRYCMRGCSAQ
jgi:hypothetical protein